MSRKIQSNDGYSITIKLDFGESDGCWSLFFKKIVSIAKVDATDCAGMSEHC